MQITVSIISANDWFRRNRAFLNEGHFLNNEKRFLRSRPASFIYWLLV